ncbi:MAG: DNA-directed RNA polymerase subunit delta [Bacilli bacterium]
MDFKKMKFEELETLSYTDIAYYLIKNNKKTRTTGELFKEVASLLKMDDEERLELIGDFFTSLTIDRRFILLSDKKWDLKENHNIVVNLDDEEDDMDEDLHLTIDDENIKTEEEYDLDEDGVEDISEDAEEEEELDGFQDIENLEIIEEEKDLEE